MDHVENHLAVTDERLPRRTRPPRRRSVIIHRLFIRVQPHHPVHHLAALHFHRRRLLTLCIATRRHTSFINGHFTGEPGLADCSLFSWIFLLNLVLDSAQGHRCWGLGSRSPLKICRRGQSMLWPPKISHYFNHSEMLDNSASFTSSRMKDVCQKWKVKLIFRGAYRLSGTRIVDFQCL